MNLSLRTFKKVAFCLVLLLGTLCSYGQSGFYQNFTLIEGEVFEWSFESNPIYPVISVHATNGTDCLEGGSNCNLGVTGDNTLTYTPNPGFLGNDTIQIRYWIINYPATGYWVETGIVISVVPSIVDAVSDFTTTNTNVPVVIDVTENDSSSEGAVSLSSISVVNNGTAYIEDGQVVFIPAFDFSGTAQLNYVVCDSIATCETGTATIFVEGNSTNNDTLNLTTAQNTPLEVILDLTNGYQYVALAANGDLAQVNDGTVVYTPDADFTGSDQFTIAVNVNGNAQLVTVNIEVIFVPLPNIYAFDDYAYTAIGQTVAIDVTLNDINTTLTNPVINDYPDHGTIVVSGGVITYTPDPNFEGVDQITYRVCTQPAYECEYANVYIHVGNQEPSQSTFELMTPMNTPLVLPYPATFDQFIFNLLVAPESGEFYFQQGNSTYVCNGQSVTGNNLLVYCPNPNTVGEDEFEMEYCVGDFCTTVKVIVNVTEIDPAPPIDEFCVEECVWAGDANNDGVVNMQDLLPLGLCAGELGIPRPNAAVAWYGQYGESWNSSFGNNVDLKYVDGDGDGLIMSSDTTPLSQFYGLRHNLTPAYEYPIERALVFQDAGSGPYEAGDWIELDIILGAEGLEAVDKYGLTFEMHYNPDIINAGSLEISFDDNSWLAYNSPMLSLVKPLYDGRTDVGLTRTAGSTVTGQGKIGKIRFIVEQDIVGFRIPNLETVVSARSAFSMNSAGQYVGLNDVDISIPISSDPREKLTEKDLVIWPNPATHVDEITLHINGYGNKIESFEVYTISGNLMYRSTETSVKDIRHDISQYQNGLYIVKAYTNKGPVASKFQVLKQ